VRRFQRVEAAQRTARYLQPPGGIDDVETGRVAGDPQPPADLPTTASLEFHHPIDVVLPT
jgi:hypothetical protein